MNMLSTRFGTADDIDALAALVLEAGEGIFEQLFEGVMPGLHAGQVVRLAVADTGSALSHTNAVVAEEAGRLLGAVLGYPAAEYGLSPVAKALVPSRRVAPLAELLESRLPGSFYINTVAVMPEARGKGLARMLVETAIEVAAQKGFDEISLHAWIDNAAAQRLYAGLGFAEIARIDVPQTRHLAHAAPIVLMRTTVEAARAGMAR